MDKCKCCKWWDGNEACPEEKDEDKTGQCHRNAPQTEIYDEYEDDEIKDKRILSRIVWPFTSFDNWCGEFQPKKR